LREALPLVEKSLALRPEFAEALNTRAHIREALGDLRGALGDFQKSAALGALRGESADGLIRVRAQLAELEAPLPSQTPPAAATPAITERRVALVIGNSAYRSVQELPNPRRDATAIAEAFRSLGFQTVRFESDLSREQLVGALNAFAVEADRADWAVIYFAGHGIEVGGVNYLIPVDAHLVADRDVQFEAVPLDQVLGAVEGARKLRLVLLDACRENPFKMRRTLASRAVGRGLKPIEPAPGTLVSYATKDGQVALDGDGANSPFAAALLKEIKTPGIEINKLFRLVHDDVMEMTGNRQEPYTYGALPGREDYYFVAR
jgi:Caspase domain